MRRSLKFRHHEAEGRGDPAYLNRRKRARKVLDCFAALAMTLSIFSFTNAALAAEAPLKNEAQEQRAREIFYSLRCVVCEGQSVADSPAAVAQDVRAAVRERVKKGESDEKIREFLVSRYGEQVLMTPRLSPRTYLLWFGPALMLFLGGAVVFAYLSAGTLGRRRK